LSLLPRETAAILCTRDKILSLQCLPGREEDKLKYVERRGDMRRDWRQKEEG
jgi:hypothetical protein